LSQYIEERRIGDPNDVTVNLLLRYIHTFTITKHPHVFLFIDVS